MINKVKSKIYHSLRWSERYTKTDMVYLAKGGFWLSLSQVFSSLCSLAMVVAFANLISPELYGKYRYVISVLGILAIATFQGMNSVAIKSVADGEEAVFWKLIRRRVWWSLGGTVASLAVASYYFIQGNFELALVFIIAAAAVPLSSLTGMYASFLNGKKDFKRLAIWSSLAKLVMTTALLVALPWVKSLPILILFYFLPEIITEAIFLVKLYKRQTLSEKGKQQVDKLSRSALHFSAMEILKSVSGQIDKILVFHYLGAAELALYTIATTAPSQIKGVLQNMTTLSLPKFSQVAEKDIRTSLPAKLFKLELIVLGLVIAYWAVAPVAFPIIFPKYAGAVFISQIYALSLVFFPRTFFSTAMTAHLKHRQMYGIRTLAPILRIIIFAVALPFWGLWGAVVGSIISNALTAIIYQYFFRRAFVVSSTH